MELVLKLSIVCFLCAAVHGLDIQKRALSSADNIRLLVIEEKALREKLQARVRQLQGKTDGLIDSVVQCDCSAVNQLSNSTTPQIAYTGTLPAAISSLTGSTVFNFTNDLVNIGSGFKSRSGHFVAPVSGLYGFSLTLFMNQGYWSGFNLVKNGNGILNVKTGHYYSSSNNRQVNVASNYVISNLTAGMEVWPQYVTGTGRIWADGVTTFSASLLHAF